MTEHYFLGIDGGGTKTRSVVIDQSHCEIARAVSGPSNYHSVGQATAAASLREAVHQVVANAGIKAADVKAIGMGLAGVARPYDYQVLHDIVARIVSLPDGASSDALSGPHIAITHDAEAALIGGVGYRADGVRPHGVVLIAGTGAIAYGVNARGQSRRADGWGYLLGDDGSAYWIGREGLRAVSRACDGRGRPTALRGLLYADLGLGDCSELVNRIYSQEFDVPQVASVAALVEQAAQEGDPVATEILQQAGRRLGCTLCTVVRNLDMTGETFEAVLSGGVLRAVHHLHAGGIQRPQGLVRDIVVAALHETAPYASAIEPRHDAAFGAALLAQCSGDGKTRSGGRTASE
jgi:N-acetylglucosamine kinase